MLKLLVKKQLQEIFKSYFFDQKKNTMRSKGKTVFLLALFFIFMTGLFGAFFTALATSTCSSLTAAGAGWLYFLLMNSLAIVLGTFGSVFNTFSGLYLAKDNDLLLSMPIPVKYIILSRLSGVYLLGCLFSFTASISAAVVYFVTVKVTLWVVFANVLLILLISVIVLILSCILGYGVAKISGKLKKKSFITLLLSLLFIGAYYFFYFRASLLVQNLIQNASYYGEKLRGSLYGLYLFGRFGEGDPLAVFVCTAVVLLLAVGTWFLLSRSFLSIATASGKAEEKKAKTKEGKVRTPSRALLSKEFKRFTSSANYMLNCGFGILFMLIFAVVLFFKGDMILQTFEQEFFSLRPGSPVMSLAFITLTTLSMNDMATPSVSLEGKSIWILQSLPVDPAKVLFAKLKVQFLLTAVPALLLLISAKINLKIETVSFVLLSLFILISVLLFAAFDLMIGIRMANLTWINEIVPIKQNISVLLAMLAGFIYSGSCAAIFFMIGYRIGVRIYLLLLILLAAGLSLLCLRYLGKRGAERFAHL